MGEYAIEIIESINKESEFNIKYLEKTFIEVTNKSGNVFVFNYGLPSILLKMKDMLNSEESIESDNKDFSRRDDMVAFDLNFNVIKSCKYS